MNTCVQYNICCYCRFSEQ